MKREIDEDKIKRAVRMIIEAVGEDPDRGGLRETPERVARMYAEVTRGYYESPEAHLCKTFDTGRAACRLVVERDIAFSSTCEHHLMPFFGKVHIAYIPGGDGKVVGLSKLARVVDLYARRLQLQERMASEICEAIWAHLRPVGVAVAVEAEHTCMTARGVKKIGSKTLSFCSAGEIDEDKIFALLNSEGK